MKIKFILLVCLGFFCGNLLAQEKAASISAEGNVVLPVDAPLADTYIVPVYLGSFPAPIVAEQHVNEKSTEKVTFKAVDENKYVKVFLDLNAHPEWGVAEWNTYLSEIDNVAGAVSLKPTSRY